MDDTLLLLDYNTGIDEILKNKFYQIHFIKNNYNNILENFESVSGFVLKYLMKSLCFLETNAMKIFQYCYDNLDENHFKDLIKNMHNISLFCDSDSIFWKYKNLLYNFEKKNKGEDNINNEEY